MNLPGGNILEGQEPYKALYLHLPFCKSKCHYCDFKSTALPTSDARIEAYVDDLILQIRSASRADLLGKLETVYIGGGTPTHIGNKQLSRLLYALGLSMHLTPEVECTLEVNPESLTEAMVKDVFALGVTRLSIGVQSFDDAILATLGRAHDAACARRAIELAKVRFENISVDLMCGLPGQTNKVFLESLQTAVELGVQHISVYPLTIEEGTVFYNRFVEGDAGAFKSAATNAEGAAGGVEGAAMSFAETEEQLAENAAEMMLLAQEYLAQQGFHRYEVASYARAGYECRHNIAYWTGKPYLGIGSAAVTMKQNSLERVRLKAGEVQEVLSRAEMLVEDLMLGMRMSRGVSVSFAQEVDREVPGVLAAFDELIEAGFVRRAKEHTLCSEKPVHDSCNKDLEEFAPERFEPTDKGWLYGNALYGRLLELS